MTKTDSGHDSRYDIDEATGLLKTPLELDFAPLNMAKVRLPTADRSAPPEYLPTAGRMTLAWGGLELEVNELISRTISFNKSHVDQWERRNFRKRKELLKDQSKQAFDKNPNILNYIKYALDMASDLHWRRNLIVHGRITMEMSTVTMTTRLLASGRHNGRDITAAFSADDIDNLFYMIAHVCGVFSVIMSGGKKLPLLTSHDTNFLEAFLANSQWSPPTLNIPPIPPQAWRP